MAGFFLLGLYSARSGKREERESCICDETPVGCGCGKIQLRDAGNIFEVGEQPRMHDGPRTRAEETDEPREGDTKQGP